VLVRQFQTSRITIGRAMRELAQRGLVDRVPGSGTYVRRAHRTDGGLLFGLLIPDLGQTEIFEPICQGIASAPQASRHALLWGHTDSVLGTPEERALALCEQLIERRVSGVFFAPLEMVTKARDANLSILKKLEEARIPVVLLDRCVMPYPQRSRYDLVGIDNRRAAYMATEHLLNLGAERVTFVARCGDAPTVEARIAGFRETMLASGRQNAPVHRVSILTAENILPLLKHHKAGDGYVCANDRTAGHLMHVLVTAGYRIPEDVRIVGIDDVEYASLLPVPLTTVHQPCREIGQAALNAMLFRIEQPAALTRDILLECRLIIRASSGRVQPAVTPRRNQSTTSLH